MATLPEQALVVLIHKLHTNTTSLVRTKPILKSIRVDLARDLCLVEPKAPRVGLAAPICTATSVNAGGKVSVSGLLDCACAVQC